ncbi:MAG: hypothetical protein ACE5HF_08860 [Gemmatimonadota bacterium]
MTRAMLLLIAAGAAACGDPFQVTLIPNPDTPTEFTLADFNRGPLEDPPAFDLLSGGDAVRTDQVPGWDFVFVITPAGNAQFWPRGQIVSGRTDAGLQLVSGTFDGLDVAPATGYKKAGSIPLAVGDVIAVVSRSDPTFGGLRCRHYAKLEILDLDLSALTVTFQILINPNCEQRSLKPGDQEAI